MRRPRWIVVVVVLGLAGGLMNGNPARAIGAGFASSFEAGERQPDWVDGVERGNGAVVGSRRDRVVGVAVSGEPVAHENGRNLNDGNPRTKWLVDTPASWARYTLDAPATVIRYSLTSADDAPERDPRDWTLEGSGDGETWTTVDTRAGESFGERFQSRTFEVADPGSFPIYRLHITGHPAGNLTQLAEWELTDAKAPGPMRSRVGAGPASSPTAKANVGYTGLAAFEIAGHHTTEGAAFAYHRIFDVDLEVKGDTELSYLMFPEDDAGTYAAVDLAFTDGSYLSQLGARDQHGIALSPGAQGASQTLYTSQWNLKRARIGAVAAGKTVARILVGYERTGGPGNFRTWFDDVVIAEVPAPKPKTKLSAYADTRRGTQSSGEYSRGNNFPATAVPHGFNFWTPVTDAGSTSWLYQWSRQNNAANRPTIQAFSASHEPSPWMGDRQTFQLMPSTAPDAGRTARALAFGHAGEEARPYYYGVTFDNGIRAELAPADHAAIFRFTFPGDDAHLILDNVNGNSGLTIDAAGRSFEGWSDVNSGGLSAGWTRMYVYATVDVPITASGMLPAGNRPSTGYLSFGASEVTVRIATSLISVAQARHNLGLEIAADATLESVRDRAQSLWEAKMRTVEVEGATEDQLVTLYSNLYRLFLYPNSGHENTGTNEAPVHRHTVQSAVSSPATGAPVRDGKVYVNNGFWDTYRTTWPAYALLTPGAAGEMVDGFVQQYRDGGWISRWSSPGYANLMVGTSSDVAFADAYRKGVPGFDVDDAYRAALRNATVTPPNQNVGRKGLATSIFKGYTPSEVTGEAMSWALDGYINDFGIAGMAATLADKTGNSRYADEAAYFRNRALNYVNMFDSAVGFFQGRDSAGKPRLTPEQYDPRVWGYDYTETNGWNMAFHVPHDGQGLANLYGGREGLAAKLDAFFATPETARFPGSYGGTIHEMLEARDVRMGQYGHSNQPSHHIIYMYNYAGKPHKTQALVREALSRLYLGSEIGQGYPGDEDNGEMSAWQIFSALGFYPLRMGSADYVIGSPLFTRATVHLENGRTLVVNAPDNSPANVYVQNLKINGQPYASTSVPHAVLADGAVLDFAMGPAPSPWGADSPPPSLTTGDAVATPLRDLTGPGAGTASIPALVDDTTATRAAVDGTFTCTFTGAGERAELYTLTSAATTGTDPASWRLRGSADGITWTTLDERSGQVFDWRLQTRPFRIAEPGRYRHYALDLTGSLAEVELLGRPER